MVLIWSDVKHLLVWLSDEKTYSNLSQHHLFVHSLWDLKTESFYCVCWMPDPEGCTHAEEIFSFLLIVESSFIVRSTVGKQNTTPVQRRVTQHMSNGFCLLFTAFRYVRARVRSVTKVLHINQQSEHTSREMTDYRLNDLHFTPDSL